MNKTIPITIGGQLFHIEENAYALLKEYLDSVSVRFAGNAESQEIISDIEGRIAEHFSDNKKLSDETAVTRSAVEKIIASMGRPEEFEQNADEVKKTSAHEPLQGKKLFRNPDDVVVAGVASGLAAYFNIDPLIVRIIFIFSLFVGGGGVLAYLIFWLIMPIARTATEKLQMRGQRVTLDSISETIKDKVEEVKKNKGIIRKIISFPFLVIATVLRVFFTKIMPVIGRILGIFIAIAAAAGIVIASATFSAALLNVHSPYVDFPLAQVLHGPQLYILVAAAWLAIIIPAIFAMQVGISLLRRKNSFHLFSGFSLLGIWFVALIVLGAVMPNTIARYSDYLRTNPEYQTVTKKFDATNFDSISVANGTSVTVVQGPEFAVTMTGKAKNLDSMSASVHDHTLEIKHADTGLLCIFCINNAVEVTVTMPAIHQLSASNSAQIKGINLSSPDFILHLENGSQADLQIIASTTTLYLENSSSAALAGTSTVLTLELHNASEFMGKSFVTQTADIVSYNSSQTTIQVTQKLTAKAYNASSIEYLGTPILDTRVNNSSSIRKWSENSPLRDEYNYPNTPPEETIPQPASTPY